ncbi:MAG: lipid II flippase MurJ [Paludibaculum sp.]
MLLLLPSLPLTACNIIWRCVLNSANRFALAALAPAATPLLSIAFLYLGAGRWGIETLAVGTVAGGVVEAALLACGVRRMGYPLLPEIRSARARLAPVLRQFGTIVLGSLLFGGIPLIDNAMAAALPAGSLSVFGFGTKLVLIILSLGPTSVAAGALPQLARLAVNGEWRAMSEPGAFRPAHPAGDDSGDRDIDVLLRGTGAAGVPERGLLRRGRV